MLEFVEYESRIQCFGDDGAKDPVATLSIVGNEWALYSMDNLSYLETNELRQIAAKLLELNGDNTLQFIEQDDGVINIKNECGDDIGDLVKRDGMYRLTFLYTYDNADGLYQIADKLKQLNGDQDA